MPLTMRPTGLSSPVDKDRQDFTTYSGDWGDGALCFHAIMSLKRNDHHEARRLARRAFYRQHGLCFWCRRPMMWGHRGGNGVCDPLTATADHVKPVWGGGQTLPGNIVAACCACNQDRGRITNRTKRGSKFTIGDDTPSSPFEILRVQLEDEKKLDERREQVKWRIRSGEL